MIKKIFALCLLSFFVFGWNLSFALKPDDIIYISKEKERQMGASIAKQVEDQFEDTDDPLLQKRLEEIGKKLADVCDRKDFIYRFKVLKAKEGREEEYFNAFALPGGYVYMFDAMIKKLKTDDKIAAVTAHEIGHICARHPVKRLQSSLGMNALMLLAVALSRDGRTAAEANEAITQLMMSYSRDDEFEADRLSVKYVKKAGFDPSGVVRTLETLKKMRKKGKEMTYSYYKTHPYLSERIAAVRSEIKGYTDFDSYINIPDEKDGFY